MQASLDSFLQRSSLQIRCPGYRVRLPFPYAAYLSRQVDLDQQIPYAEGGPTSTNNLGPMTRTHHRIKTHAGWQVRQPFPGIVIWRDPHGAHYLVDQTGTRKVTATRRDRTPPRPDRFGRVVIVCDLAA